MNPKSTCACSLLLLLACASFAKSEAEIKQSIVEESIQGYRGTCPCPESIDRSGVACGKRSVYSRTRGFEPVCHASDVTPEMIRSWKSEHKTRKGSK